MCLSLPKAAQMGHRGSIHELCLYVEGLEVPFRERSKVTGTTLSITGEQQSIINALGSDGILPMLVRPYHTTRSRTFVGRNLQRLRRVLKHLATICHDNVDNFIRSIYY